MCSHPQHPLLLNPLLFPCSKLLFSSQLGPNAGLALARTLAENSVASGVFQSRGFPSLQSFPEDPRPHDSRILCDTNGPAPYLAPAVLAKNLFPIPRLASGMLSPQDGPSLCLSCSPLEGPSPVSDRHPIGTDLQKEGCYDRCLQLRLRSSVQAQTAIRLLVHEGSNYSGGHHSVSSPLLGG